MLKCSYCVFIFHIKVERSRHCVSQKFNGGKMHFTLYCFHWQHTSRAQCPGAQAQQLAGFMLTSNRSAWPIFPRTPCSATSVIRFNTPPQLQTHTGKHFDRVIRCLNKCNNRNTCEPSFFFQNKHNLRFYALTNNLQCSSMVK